MTALVEFLLEEAAAPVDPNTYLVPVLGVVAAALLNIAAVVIAGLVSGRRSDKALARTIEADRAARVLERRLDLYGDMLTFAAKRKQHRNVTMTAIVVNGMERLDPFEPGEVFDLGGRASAIADVVVLAAWKAADEADMASVRAWNMQTRGRSEPGGVERVEKAFAAKDAADMQDTALEGAIRSALHQDGGIVELDTDATPESTE